MPPAEQFEILAVGSGKGGRLNTLPAGAPSNIEIDYVPAL